MRQVTGPDLRQMIVSLASKLIVKFGRLDREQINYLNNNYKPDELPDDLRFYLAEEAAGRSRRPCGRPTGRSGIIFLRDIKIYTDYCLLIEECKRHNQFDPTKKGAIRGKILSKIKQDYRLNMTDGRLNNLLSECRKNRRFRQVALMHIKAQRPDIWADIMNATLP